LIQNSVFSHTRLKPETDGLAEVGLKPDVSVNPPMFEFEVSVKPPFPLKLGWPPDWVVL
jgi:hypothetical protein